MDTPVLLRHESDLGEWESATRQPAPKLREYVRRYQGWRESTAGRNMRREVPTGDVVAIINFGEPFHVINVKTPRSADTPLSSFASGVSDCHVFTELGPMHVLQVDFTPVGAHLLFGLPMHEIANREVHLEDLLGPAAVEIEERMREALAWETRFALLDDFLERRFALASAPEPGVVWALHRLHRTGGGAEIASIARKLGWSDRRLIDAFREHVGVTPNTIAWIIRFNRVSRALGQGSPVRWVDLAYAYGYYDQAHLVHEFKRLSGLTPTEFLAYRQASGLLLA